MRETAALQARVMVIGDLHISDHFKGQHIDYLQNCIEVLDQITEEIRRRQPTHVILTGDIIGVTERTFRQLDTLFYFVKLLNEWNRLTNDNLYSARGNHDMGSSLTAFEYLVGTGVIKHVPHVDAGMFRIHLMDYGDVHRALDIPPEDELDVYHIAVTHTDIRVAGQTHWMDGFSSSDTVELSSLKNLEGVQMVFGGHIHTPSETVARTSIGDSECAILYLGNPTRVKKERNIWNHYFLGLLESGYSGDDTATMDTITMKLRPAEEIFRIKEASELEEKLDESKPLLDADMLMDVLKNFNDYDMRADVSYKEQVKIQGGGDERAIAIAMQYIEAAEKEFKNG